MKQVCLTFLFCGALLALSCESSLSCAMPPVDASKSYDLVTLKNGKQVYGEISTLPDLSYNFGNLHFDPKEVAEVDFYSQGDELKARYRTVEGVEFIGSITDTPLLISLSKKNAAKPLLEQIEPRMIKNVTLKSDIADSKAPSEAFFVVELKNGDRLVGMPLKQHFTVVTEGALKGLFPFKPAATLSKTQESLNLKGVEIRDSLLSFGLPKRNDRLSIPWADVVQLQFYNAKVPADKEEINKLAIDSSYDWHSPIRIAYDFSEPLNLSNLVLGDFPNQQPDTMIAYADRQEISLPKSRTHPLPERSRAEETVIFIRSLLD